MDKKLIVNGQEISLLSLHRGDFISLTDMARSFEGDAGEYIRNWLRNGSTVEFLGVLEKVHNPDSNLVEFHQIKSELTRNTFIMSVKKWIELTGAVGIEARAGRYGGTYAHSDIAVQFATWLSPEFYVYLVKEFQRLKEEESRNANLAWDVSRIMSKANYHIHAEAVRQHLIPPRLQYSKMEGSYFASEADLLNLSLFGLTAKQWRLANPEKKGNMRDHATPEQLLVLSNLQSLNARLMKWGCDAEQRLQILNETAIEEMEILISYPTLRQLPEPKSVPQIPAGTKKPTKPARRKK